MAKSEENSTCDLNFFREKIYRKSVFRNPEVLDFTYIPEMVTCRDDILTSLIFHFRRILFEKNLSTNCLLLGPCGSGKTTVSKFFIKNFRQIALEQMPDFIIEYINCIEIRTINPLISQLVQKYCHLSGKGYSDNEGWRNLFTYLKRHKSYLFIVLDEVQNFSQKSLLELLSLSEAYGHQNTPLSFLLISREEDWIPIETEKILSRINLKLKMEPYTYDSVNEILSRRGLLAFNEDILSNEIIKAICKITTETKNMRHGINILRKCGVYANERNENRITLEMVQKASEEAYSEYRKVIDHLKEHELLTLYSFLLELENKESTTNFEAYQRYKSICYRFNTKPHVSESFKKHGRDLETNHLLISKTVRSKETYRGARKEIRLPNTLNGIVKELEHYFGIKYPKKTTENEVILKNN